MMKTRLGMSLLAGAMALAASTTLYAQGATSGSTSTTDSSGFAAGRHADGSTGVRKAQSSSTTSTSGVSTGGTSSAAGSSSTSGSGGSATAGSGVSASTLGTGGSSAGTQNSTGGTATSATGTGSSATATGPSGRSTSSSSGSSADPAPGASGYAHDKAHSSTHGKDAAPGQRMK